MGWSPMMFTFVEGAETPVPLDLASVRALLEPYDVGAPGGAAADGTLAFLVRASDGSEAEIFVDERCIGVHRPQSGGVFAILAELVSRLGVTVIDPSRAGVVCSPEAYAHLPAGLRDDALVIEPTRETLEAALTGPRRPAGP
ncbi:hypothetical protein ACFYPA_16170 [Streptomyces sp. NPDC005775]|uniref:hypothetical protein n=1 Tax=Streptomyces sp. NPDC005775 TaxID=3364729 RepID=UPI0036D1D07D